MTGKERIRSRIRVVARALGDDLPKVFVVGGAAVCLYPGPPDPRMTNDVDLVAKTTLPQYQRLVARLKKAGFKECRDEGAPACRYEFVSKGERILVDVMSVGAGALGFTSRWYADAFEHTQSVAIGAGLKVRVISPLFFAATKLEAFRNRGHGDYLASHDLEDLILVLDAIPTLLPEIAEGESEVSRALRAGLAELVRHDAFCDAVTFSFESAEAGQAKATRLLTHLQSLS